MRCLVKILKGALKGRLDVWDIGSAHNAQKKGFVEIIKIYDLEMVIK